MVMDRTLMITGNLEHPLVKLVRRHKSGELLGLYSICSANGYVLEAALCQAADDGSFVLVESTSNQVDQFGGYSGMTPRDFASLVRQMACNYAFPLERLLLGGDHLGPNRWRNEPAAAAMNKAGDLVRECVKAGYTKIHLDASMRCADDVPAQEGGSFSTTTVAERTAELCAAAEEAFRAGGGPMPPVYVIGTDVPAPGGARGELKEVEVTRPEDVAETVAQTRQAFERRGLERAWERVVAVVVQPGVEFGDSTVVAYDRRKAWPLVDYISAVPTLVYEAHSTDYQTRAALRAMVEDHFAILKVGPALTFAFREAVFALEEMEIEWLGEREGVTLSRLSDTLERVMLADNTYWRNHYEGDEAALRYARKYSYSDRSRYYWQHPELLSALRRLIMNLEKNTVPLTLVSQYLPAQYRAIREGVIANRPADLIRHKIREIIADYAYACGIHGPRAPQFMQS